MVTIAARFETTVKKLLSINPHIGDGVVVLPGTGCDCAKSLLLSAHLRPSMETTICRVEISGETTYVMSFSSTKQGKTYA